MAKKASGARKAKAKAAKKAAKRKTKTPVGMSRVRPVTRYR